MDYNLVGQIVQLGKADGERVRVTIKSDKTDQEIAFDVDQRMSPNMYIGRRVRLTLTVAQDLS